MTSLANIIDEYEQTGFTKEPDMNSILDEYEATGFKTKEPDMASILDEYEQTGFDEKNYTGLETIANRPPEPPLNVFKRPEPSEDPMLAGDDLGVRAMSEAFAPTADIIQEAAIKGTKAGIPFAKQQWGKAAQAIAQKTGAEETGQPIFSAIGKWGNKAVPEAEAALAKPELKLSPEAEKSFIGRGVYNTLNMLPMMGTTMAPALVAGVPGIVASTALTAAGYGGSKYKDFYDKAIKAGADEETADKYATIAGVAEFGIEETGMLMELATMGIGGPVGKAMTAAAKVKLGKALTGAFKKVPQYAKLTATEYGEELGQALSDVVLSEKVGVETTPFLEQAKEAAIPVALTGGLLKVTGGALSKGNVQEPTETPNAPRETLPTVQPAMPEEVQATKEPIIKQPQESPERQSYLNELNQLSIEDITSPEGQEWVNQHIQEGHLTEPEVNERIKSLQPVQEVAPVQEPVFKPAEESAQVMEEQLGEEEKLLRSPKGRELLRRKLLREQLEPIPQPEKPMAEIIDELEQPIAKGEQDAESIRKDEGIIQKTWDVGQVSEDQSRQDLQFKTPEQPSYEEKRQVTTMPGTALADELMSLMEGQDTSKEASQRVTEIQKEMANRKAALPSVGTVTETVEKPSPDAVLEVSMYSNNNNQGMKKTYLTEDGHVLVDGNKYSPGDVLYYDRENDKYYPKPTDKMMSEIKYGKEKFLKSLIEISKKINRNIKDINFKKQTSKDGVFADEEEDYTRGRYSNIDPMDISWAQQIDRISKNHDPEALEKWLYNRELETYYSIELGGKTHITSLAEKTGINKKQKKALLAYEQRGGKLGHSSLVALGRGSNFALVGDEIIEITNPEKIIAIQPPLNKKPAIQTEAKQPLSTLVETPSTPAKFAPESAGIVSIKEKKHRFIDYQEGKNSIKVKIGKQWKTVGKIDSKAENRVIRMPKAEQVNPDVETLKKSLKDKNQKGSVTLDGAQGEQLRNLAKDIYSRGHNKLSSFMVEMKRVLGDAWQKVSHLFGRLFNEAKKSAQNIAKGHVGLTQDVKEPPKKFESLADFRKRKAEERAKEKKGEVEPVKEVKKAEAKPVQKEKPKKEEYFVDEFTTVTILPPTQLQTLRQKIRDKNSEVSSIQSDLTKYAKDNLPPQERSMVLSYLKQIKTNQTVETNKKKLQKAIELTDKLREKYAQKVLKGKISSELSTIAPKMVSGKPQGRYTADVQNYLDEIKKRLNGDREIAKAQIAKNIQDYHDGKITNDEMIKSNFWASMTGLKEMTAYEMSRVLNEIRSLKADGRLTRELEAKIFNDEMDKKIKSFIAILTGDKGLKKGFGAIPREESEANKTWLESLFNNQYAWDSFLDKLSKFKKDKPYHSELSKWGNIVHDAANKEFIGFTETLEKFVSEIPKIFGVKDNKVSKVFAELKKKVDFGEVTLADGTKVNLKLSKEQILKKYMELQDPSLADTFFNKDKDDSMKWTPEIVKKIEDSLTEQEKAYGDYQLKFYQEYYETVNQIYRDYYGIDLPHNPNYSPIGREKDSDIPENVLFARETGQYGSVTNASLKSRVKNRIPLKFNDADSVLIHHIIQMEHFKAWAEPMRELRKVFNNKEVRTAITQYHGSDILKKLDVLVNDMARGSIEKSKIIHLLDKIRSNMTKSLLGGKPSIALQQIPSSLVYMTEMPIHDYMLGTAGFWTVHNGKPRADAAYQNGKLLFSKSPTLKKRYETGWEREIVLAKQKSYSKVLSKKGNISDVLFTLITTGDKFAVMQGAWAKYKSALKEGLSDAEAIKEAERVTNRTQNTSDLSSLSPWQRGGSIMSLFTWFQNQPNKYFRIIADNMRNFKYGRGSRTKAVTNVALAWVVMPALFQLINDAFEWRKDRQLQAILLGPLNNLLIIGGMVKALAARAAGERFNYQVTPLLSIFEDLARGTGRLVKEKVEMEDKIKAIEYYVEAIGKSTGIATPYAVQVERAIREGDPKQLIWTPWALDNKETKKSSSSTGLTYKPFKDLNKQSNKQTFKPMKFGSSNN